MERGKRGPQKTERGIIIKKAIVITLLVFGLVVVCSAFIVGKGEGKLITVNNTEKSALEIF